MSMAEIIYERNAHVRINIRNYSEQQVLEKSACVKIKKLPLFLSLHIICYTLVSSKVDLAE